MTEAAYGADLQSVREELVACGTRLLGKGLLTQTSGNLSIRLTAETMAITPTSIEYDRMKPEDIVVCAMDGTVLEGAKAPSSETVEKVYMPSCGNSTSPRNSSLAACRRRRRRQRP